MSQNVDNRIVNMQFNNKQFEKGANTTIKTLGNLEKSLDFSGATRGLTRLGEIGQKLTFGGLSSGIQTISSRFTTLGIVGVTALQNITNSAVNAGKKLISSLTVDPIKTGLAEYETKINAIQTILTNTASKGVTLQEVNDVLAELNEYADQTIFNFAEMTRNIGTFTAAGIDLDVAATSIKGIANLAAGSGANAQQAANAMYQLSQALAAGSLKLQDWNSVVNAGLGGELFQMALKDSARALGIFVDESVPFRESLRDGWITAEVLTNTLSGFADDTTDLGKRLTEAATQVKTFTQLFSTMAETVQSGWAVTWEQIIGDKDQATDVLTSISNGFNEVVGPSADARNETLKFWNANGGREALIKGVSNVLSDFIAVQKSVKEGFQELFPAITGERLVELSEQFRDLTEEFKIGEETLDKIKRSFKGLFAVLDIGGQLLSALGGGIVDLLSYFGLFDSDILGTTASIGDFLVNLNDTIRETEYFQNVIKNATDGVKNFATRLTDFGTIIGNVSDKVQTGVIKIVNAFKEFFTIDTSGFETLSDKFRARFEPFAFIGSAISKGLKAVIGLLRTVAPEFFELAGRVGDAFGMLQSSIMDYISDLEFEEALDVLNSGLLVGIIFGIRKFIKSLTDISNSASGILGTITGILDGVKGSLEAYQSSLKANTLLKIAGAIALLTAAVLTLSLIDSEKLTVALTAITVMFAELFGVMAAFNAISGTKGFTSMGQIAIGMIGLSTSILILSKALTRISQINTTSLIKGLGALGVVMAELAIFMKLADFQGLGVRVSLGLIGLSTAILILSKAVSSFGQLDLGSLTKGLTAIGVVLTELGLFTKLTGNSKNVISTAIGLTILGGAMLIFANAVGKLGQLSWEEIGRGLVAMAGTLAIIAGALAIMPPNIIATGAGLFVIALALNNVAKALESFGGMTWEEIAKGLVTLAGSLAIIAGAMYLMVGALPGAAALFVVAGALNLLVPALKIMGNLSWSEIGKGLLVLAGALGVIGLAGLLLTPVIPSLLGLGASVALLGVGLTAAGAGLLLFSTALAALAVSGTTGATALIVVVTGLLGLIPIAFEAIGRGIIAFAGVIESGVPALVSAVNTLIQGFVDVILKNIPLVVEAFFKLLIEVGNKLLEYGPEMLRIGSELILVFLKGILDHIQEVVKTAIKIAVEFINGVAAMLPEIIDAGFNLMINFINGLADAIDKNTPALIEAMENLITALIDAAIYILGRAVGLFEENGEFLMNGLREGFENVKEKVLTTISNIVSSVVKGITDFTSNFTQAGKDVVTGFVNGIKSLVGDAANAAKNVGSSALNSLKNLLGINSPAKETIAVGKFFDEGIIVGIKSLMRKVGDTSEDVGNEAVDSLTKVMSKAVDSIDDNLDVNPTITPVLDLSNIEQQNKQINGILGSNYNVGVGITSANMANNVDGSDLTRINTIDELVRMLKSLGRPNETSNEFNISELVVREESDINLIARQLYQLQISGARG